MGSLPPNAGPPPGGDYSQMNQGFGQGQPGFGQQQPLPPPAKGRKTWIWILGGCFGLILVLGIAAAVGVYYVTQKARQVAGDFENRPAFAAAKLIAALNPEIELVEADEKTERITIREKSTGKTITVSLDDLQKGKITFSDETGKEVTVETQGEGGEGGIKVTSEEGTQVLSSGLAGDSEVPDWVPIPTGTAKQVSKTSTPSVTIYITSVQTSMQAEELAGWLERESTAKGLAVKTRNVIHGTEGSHVSFSAQSDDEKRIIHVVGAAKPGTNDLQAVITAQEKP